MKYIMCSRYFPKGHPKAGEPTWFVEKILNCFRENYHLPDSFNTWVNNYVELLNGEDYLKAVAVRELKHHTIRPNNRFKQRETISLRVWSGLPYRSKQIEFVQVEVKKVWNIEIRMQQTSPVVLLDGDRLTFDAVKMIAENDGLSIVDFISWFNVHPKKKCEAFFGQIITWSPDVNY